MDDQIHQIEADAAELETYWQNRNTQMQEDRQIINLDKPIPRLGISNWLTNEPKVFFDTARALLSLNRPRFRLPININYSPEEKQKMNKAERLCIGIWRTLNQRHQDIGNVDWLWDMAYWVLLGWYSVFSIIEKDRGELKFRAEQFDPMTVYPKWDNDGLAVCVRSYEVDNLVAEALVRDFQNRGLQFDFTLPADGRIKIVNYWRRTFNKSKPIIENAILIGGQLVKPLTHQSKLTRIPIHVGAIGSPDRTTPNWINKKGEAIITANVDMFRYMNELIRLRAEIVAETAYPNIITKTRSGQPIVKEGQLQGHGQVVSTKLEDVIEILKHAATPEDADKLMGYFVSRAQIGGFPNVFYGGLPFEASGFAISQLMAAVKYRVGIHLNAMESIMSHIFTDFLSQYKRGRYGNITLSTEDPHSLRYGLSYLEEFTPDDVPDHCFVEVTIPISSQFDKTQAILNANQALTNGLLSRETLWETELNIQDAEIEKERIREDMVNRDPFITSIEIIERMWVKVEQYRTQGKTELANALKRYIMLKETEMGMRKGVPEKPGGIPPQQMPPEMSMSPSPDQKRAMLGMPPPGLARRPQTPEERSKKGILVSPTGEPLL